MEKGEECFRVSVCLERFFSDERARCFVSVKGSQRVRWLRRRLRRLFELPGPARRLALLTRGHLLPPDEPLSLLQPDDVVHVIPTTIDIGNTNNPEPDIEPNERSTQMDQIVKKRRRENNIQKQSSSNNDSSHVIHTQEVSATTPNATISMAENHETSKTSVTDDNDIPSIPFNQAVMETDSGPTITLAETVVTANESIIRELDRLEEVKERALALLDSVAPEPRRRRVRRRRPRRRPDASGADQAAEGREYPIMPQLMELSRFAQKYMGSHEEEPPMRTPSPPSPESSRSSLSTGSPAESAAAASASPVPRWTQAAPPAPGVLRNESVAPRAARLVRPLDPIMFMS